MSEPPTPQPLSPAVNRNTRPWWFTWIFCTVVVPGSAMTLGSMLPGGDGSVVVCGAAVLVMLLFHIVSSAELGKGASGWLTFSLIFGGWVFDADVFFLWGVCDDDQRLPMNMDEPFDKPGQ